MRKSTMSILWSWGCRGFDIWISSNRTYNPVMKTMRLSHETREVIDESENHIVDATFEHLSKVIGAHQAPRACGQYS